MKYLREIFNYSYPYKKNSDESNDRQHTYDFNSDRSRYSVIITHHNKNRFHLNPFEKRSQFATLSFFDSKNNTGISHLEKNHSLKVFGTVKKITQDHLRNHPEVKQLKFGSDVNEPSRTKLYNILANKYTPNHYRTNQGLGTIYTTDIKGS